MSIFGNTERPTPLSLAHSEEAWYSLETMSNFTGQNPGEVVENFSPLARDYSPIGTPITTINFPRHLLLDAVQEMMKTLEPNQIFISAEWGNEILDFYDRMEAIEQAEVERQKIHHANSMTLALSLCRKGYAIIPTAYTRIAEGRPEFFFKAITDKDGDINKFLAVESQRWDVLSVPYDEKGEKFSVSYDSRLKVHEADGWRLVVSDGPWTHGHSYMIRRKQK